MAQGPRGRDRQGPTSVASRLVAVAAAVAGATAGVPRTIFAGTARVGVAACSAAGTDLKTDTDADDHSPS